MNKSLLSALPLAFLSMASCGQKEKEVLVPIEIPEFFSLQNFKNADATVRVASQAVVKLQMANGSSGTGFFISNNGILMTNDHVLGLDNCTRTGCFFTIFENYQIDRTPNIKEVFAEPLMVKPGLDMTVYQMYDVDDQGQKKQKLVTRNYLKFSKRTGKSLVDEEVFLVGHPHGRLKKWSKGKVFSYDADWFTSDIYALPGNSGSPLLNNKGQVVGLVHRSQLDATNITRNGYRGGSIATSSAALMEAIGLVDSQALSLATLEPIKSIASYIDLADLKDDEYKKYEDLFISAKKLPNSEQFSLTADEHPFAAKFEETCDNFLDNLNSTNLLSLGDLQNAMYQNCSGVMKWFDCGTTSEVYSFCPTNKFEWRERFKKMSLVLRENNIGGSTYDYTNTLFSMEGNELFSDEKALQEFVELMNNYSDDIREDLNFEVGYIKLALGQKTHNKTDLVSYFKAYKKQPQYYRYYNLLVRIPFDGVDKQKLLIKEALNHPETTLSDKLSIESFGFENKLIDANDVR